MDPLVDRHDRGAFISLVPLGAIPAWAATIGRARFLITGLRLMAARRAGAGGRLGKHKTSWQIVTVVFFLAC